MSADFLLQALDLARRGKGQTSPNPAVGAVLVRDGEVVGRGFHTYGGLKHAEILALDDCHLASLRDKAARERRTGLTGPDDDGVELRHDGNPSRRGLPAKA